MEVFLFFIFAELIILLTVFQIVRLLLAAYRKGTLPYQKLMVWILTVSAAGAVCGMGLPFVVLGEAV